MNPVHGLILEDGKSVMLVKPDGTFGDTYPSPNAFLSAKSNRHYLLFYRCGQYTNIDIRQVRTALNSNQPEILDVIPHRQPQMTASTTSAALYILNGNQVHADPTAYLQLTQKDIKNEIIENGSTSSAEVEIVPSPGKKQKENHPTIPDMSANVNFNLGTLLKHEQTPVEENIFLSPTTLSGNIMDALGQDFGVAEIHAVMSSKTEGTNFPLTHSAMACHTPELQATDPKGWGDVADDTDSTGQGSSGCGDDIGRSDSDETNETEEVEERREAEAEEAVSDRIHERGDKCNQPRYGSHHRHDTADTAATKKDAEESKEDVPMALEVHPGQVSITIDEMAPNALPLPAHAIREMDDAVGERKRKKGGLLHEPLLAGSAGAGAGAGAGALTDDVNGNAAAERKQVKQKRCRTNILVALLACAAIALAVGFYFGTHHAQHHSHAPTPAPTPPAPTPAPTIAGAWDILWGINNTQGTCGHASGRMASLRPDHTINSGRLNCEATGEWYYSMGCRMTATGYLQSGFAWQSYGANATYTDDSWSPPVKTGCTYLVNHFVLGCCFADS
jgi:hypothetical protein